MTLGSIVRECPACNKSFTVGGRGHPARTQICCSRTCAISHRWGADLNQVNVNHAAFALEHPTAWGIAWAAGFYEGEGHCCKANSEFASVTQLKPWALERFQALFGGRISNKTIYKSGNYAGRER